MVIYPMVESANNHLKQIQEHEDQMFHPNLFVSLQQQNSTQVVAGIGGKLEILN